MHRGRLLSAALAALVVLLAAGPLPAFAADEDFATIAKRILAESHARNFREGNVEGCVSLYADNAKFFVDHKLAASGTAELRKFYTHLREADGVRSIEIEDFVEVGGQAGTAWAFFNYRKDYDLRSRDPRFLKAHQLEGFSTLIVRQYGTAVFVKRDHRWRIQTMTVFDPGKWEPRKE